MVLAYELDGPVQAETPGQGRHVLLFCVSKTNNCAARLPKALKSAGFAVSGLSPKESLLTATRHLDRHVTLRSGHRASALLASLERAYRALVPDIIMPVDERAITLLAYFVQRERNRRGTISPPLLACLTRSLGRLDTLHRRISKSEIQRLAASLGLRVPGETVVETSAEAISAGASYGYPVALKMSHGAGGAAVRICRDRADLARRFRDFDRRRSSFGRRIWQKAFDCEWYGGRIAISVQRHVAGRPAMTTAAAVSGRTAAILAGYAEETRGGTSPASVIRLARHAGMESASQALITALGPTGFISFDFIVDAEGREYLLECNARPIRATLLAPMAGLDLAAAFAHSLAGGALGVVDTMRSEEITVALFPQKILAGQAGIVSDVPLDDPPLLKMLIDQRNKLARKLARRERWRRLLSMAAAFTRRAPVLAGTDDTQPMAASSKSITAMMLWRRATHRLSRASRAYRAPASR